MGKQKSELKIRIIQISLLCNVVERVLFFFVGLEQKLNHFTRDIISWPVKKIQAQHFHKILRDAFSVPHKIFQLHKLCVLGWVGIS